MMSLPHAAAIIHIGLSTHGLDKRFGANQLLLRLDIEPRLKRPGGHRKVSRAVVRIHENLRSATY